MHHITIGLYPEAVPLPYPFQAGQDAIQQAFIVSVPHVGYLGVLHAVVLLGSFMPSNTVAAPIPESHSAKEIRSLYRAALETPATHRPIKEVSGEPNTRLATIRQNGGVGLLRIAIS